MKQYLAGLCFLVGSLATLAQDESGNMTVFNTQGKIMKSFYHQTNHDGYLDRGNGYPFGYTTVNHHRMVIERVPDEDQNSYYLLYQTRQNDHNYGANIVRTQWTLVQFNYNITYHFCYYDVPLPPEHPIINYEIIKANRYITSASQLNGYLREVNPIDSFKKEVFSHYSSFQPSAWANITLHSLNRYNRLKRAVDSAVASVSDIDVEMARLTNQKQNFKKRYDIYKDELTKLAGQIDVEATPASTGRITIELLKLQKQMDLRDSLIAIETKKKKGLGRAQKATLSSFMTTSGLGDINKKFTLWAKKKFHIHAPFACPLHKGFIIRQSLGAEDDIGVVIYDYHAEKLEGTEKENFHLFRQSTFLPQLYMQDQLYAMIVNLKKGTLEKHPFLLSLHVDQSQIATEADLAQGPGVHGSDIIETLTQIDLPKFNLGGSPTAPSVRSFDDSVTVNNEEKKQLNAKWKAINDTWEPIKALKNKDFTPTTLSNLKTVLANMKAFIRESEKCSKQASEMGWIDVWYNAFVRYNQVTAAFNSGFARVFKEIAFATPCPELYVDYLMRHEKPLKYRAKPKIEVKGTNYQITEYEMAFAKGKTEGANYKVKRELTTLVSDELPPVRKRYRMAITSGLLADVSTEFAYEKKLIDGTQNSFYFEEIQKTSLKVRPTMFFSLYYQPQDFYRRPAFRKYQSFWHIDFGIDYSDNDLLDRFYLGWGYEFSHFVNISCGASIARTPRINLEAVNPVSLDLSSHGYTELVIRPYVGINLGIDLIPKTISTLFKKPS